MGQVNFITDIDKNVDITKTVFLDVFKDVDADVDIQGRLATAEASADALGPVGTGNGGPFTFIIDDFDSPQLIEADPDETNPNMGSVAMLPTETDLPNATRNVEVNVVLGQGTSTFESDCVVPVIADDGGLACFSNDTGNQGRFEIDYEFDTPVDVLNGALLATARLELMTAGSDDGEIVNVEFEDADGTRSRVSIVIPEDTEEDPDNFDVPLADFNNPGNIINPGGNNEIDFDQIVDIDIIVEEELDSDTYFDQLAIRGEIPGGGGTLAETDTFAQVDDSGAYAFSESLAAFDPGNNNDFFLA